MKNEKLKMKPTWTAVKAAAIAGIFNFGFMLSALGAGTAAAAQPVTPGDEAADTYLTMIGDPWYVRHSIIICGLLLFLLGCLWWRRRRRTLELFANAGGRVHVAHLALADLVENVAQEFSPGSRPRAVFRRRGGKLHTTVRLKIAAGQRLPQFSSALQTRVALALREALGIENLGAVDIVVTGYTGTPALPEESPVPYHGAAPAKAARAAKPAAKRADEEYFGNH